MGGLSLDEDGEQVLGFTRVEFMEELGLEMSLLLKTLVWLLFILRPESTGEGRQRDPLSPGWESWKSQGIKQSLGPSRKQGPKPKKRVQICYQHERGQKQM